jgi:uncharacterized membrane protein
MPKAAAAPEPEVPSPVLDWESLIGGKWALWIGSISIFLAIASFLAYTWRYLPPPPPAAKVAMGLGAGVAALVAGAFLRERTQRWFSEGLFGAGLGILYLSVWAAAQYFHLIAFTTAFASLALITATGVYLAVRYDAVSLITLATIGGFLTPLLLQGEGKGGGVVPFLTYIAVLITGILSVSLFKKWRGIVWLSFVATILVVGGWSIDSYSAEHLWPIFAFYTLYFLLFLGTSCFYSLAHRETTAHEDLLLFFAASSLYAVIGFSLVHDALGAYPGLFPLALTVFFALLSLATRTMAPDNRTLRYSAEGLALCGLTIFIPIQLKQEWITVGWNVEAAMLLILSSYFRSDLFKRCGQIVWMLSLAMLPITLETTHSTPKILFLNEAALPLLLSFATAALVTARYVVLSHRNDEWQDELAGGYAAYAVTAGAWLLTRETKTAFDLWHSNAAQGWQEQGGFMVACLLSLYALAVFSIGLRYRHLVLRGAALCVATVATALPLWFGTTQLHASMTPFWNVRWLSYVVVSVTLALLGWMVTREKDVLAPEEAESLSFWPAGTALFLLTGLTTEFYAGFARQPGNWQSSAYFAIAMLWSVYAALLLQLGYSWRQPILRMLAYFIGGAGSIFLLINACRADGVAAPLLNLRFFSFAVVLGSLASFTLISRRQIESTDDENSALTCIHLLAALVLVWGLTQETYEACRYLKQGLGTDWRLCAGFLITLLWQGLATAFWSIGLRLNRIQSRTIAYLLNIGAIGLLLICAGAAWRLEWMPIFNLRFVAYIVGAAILATGAALLHRYRDRLTASEGSWAMGVGLAAATLLLWGLTQEAHELCYYTRHALGPNWDRRAQMAISLVWSLYGALLLIGGISRSYQPVRLAGLGLLGLTVLKVFLFDLSFLEASMRILSLGSLGAALIFISWLYSRFGIERKNPTFTARS